MTLEQLRAKVREWDRQHAGEPVASAHYEQLLNQLQYHAEREWRVYLPAEHPDFDPNYMERLARWIGNLTDESDQKLLLEYARYISFFSHDDFAAMYRTAFDREIMPWVARKIGANLSLGAKNFHDMVIHQVNKKTWFCPITDSMDINEFYKVNHLQGVGHRPHFSTLQYLAENAGTPNPGIAGNVSYYMANPRTEVPPPPALDLIVLLEDIVGSGSQSIDAVRWATETLGKPVLFIPLIICPRGVEALRKEEARLAGRLTLRPVIELRRCDLLGPERKGAEGWSIAAELECLANHCSTNVKFNYGAFGYKNTGSSLVTYSNTPDNTLPIVHDVGQFNNWRPLFPRVYRDG